MIGYTTLGTNDLDRALAFYDGMVEAMGGKRLMTMPDARGFTLYGAGRGKPMLAVTRPYDGGTASAGNGTMVALMADSRAQVDAIYHKAIELGGSDEGAPGLRGGVGDQAFYGAYFRDPDGNKFCAYRTGPA
ncbi:MAG: VOC family protein [Pseudomonadota bacterium]|uniref:VOC family protein n=1 Tax=Sphingomonas sp. ERG5 TaxID=1381597 RepID=UPI00054C0DDA|nr:VOC family protein [Sphingomonas sp. ERG5]